MQFLIDHPWFMEGGESLPVHKDSPGMLSGYPLRLTSGHTRWSIHSISRDQAMLLQLQRGEPVLWMHPGDMTTRGLQDHDKIRIYNDHGSFEARVRPGARIQPGMLQLFHAWEPYQFKDWQGQQTPVTAPWKGLHLAGGYSQLHYRMFYGSPGHNPRGVGVEVEKVV
jgi:nitrate reductase alpha subunit